MKKIAIIFLSVLVSQLAHAQITQWLTGLNTFTGSAPSNIGSHSKNAINFYTYDTLRASIGSLGNGFKIYGLAGSSRRFLQADESGILLPWVGTVSTNSVFTSDGTFKFNPITVTSSTMFSTPSGARFGIGVVSPAVALDVAGDIASTGSINASYMNSSGLLKGANISTTGSVTAVNVISSGSVTAANVISSGSVTGANIISSGLVRAVNVTSTGSLSAASIVSTGSISGTNITSSGSVTASQLKISGAASGTLTGLLQSDVSGNVSAWAGSISGSDKILYGDGSFKNTPVLYNGTDAHTIAGAKFGIGVASPTTALDVFGDAKASGYIGTQGISIGNASDYGAITYKPASGDLPPFFVIGARGSASTSPSANYPNHDGDGGTAMPNTGDFCRTGMILSAAYPMTSYHNDILINKMNGFGTSATSYGNVRIGHDGNRGYIEIQGSNPNNSVSSPLSINFCGRRNVYLFGGESFEASLTAVMSVTGKLNVTDNVQIGSTSTTFVDNATELYVSGSEKVRQAGQNFGVRVVNADGDSEEAISVFRTTDATDGDQRFMVLSDGQTNINTTNPDAFIITDVNHSNAVNFKVKASGFVYAREVIVTLNTFPDYVFSKNYNLPALKDIRDFIKTNHRLPNMPSASEVEKNGANLGEIQKVTVEKVEELYLYILQLEEKINDLNKKLNQNNKNK